MTAICFESQSQCRKNKTQQEAGFPSKYFSTNLSNFPIIQLLSNNMYQKYPKIKTVNFKP